MQFHRDFPTGCNSSTKTTLTKRPFFKPSKFRAPESYPWWRKVSATKSKPISTQRLKKPTFPNMKNHNENIKKMNENDNDSKPRYNPLSNEKSKINPFPKIENWNEGNEKETDRIRVLTMIKMFREKCREIALSGGSTSFTGVNRIDFRAKEELKKEGKLCISSSKILGSIPGIKVGDRFEYRVELTLVGLHGKLQHGIDYMEYKGKSLATCVVAKEGYMDKMNDSEVITYTGEGGIVRNKEGHCPKDQKLIRGNLAMKNSMISKTDVRVVRGVKLGGRNGDSRLDKATYIYDGLYRVVSYEEKKGACKNVMFEFKLKRCPGQCVVRWQKLKNA